MPVYSSSAPGFRMRLNVLLIVAIVVVPTLNATTVSARAPLTSIDGMAVHEDHLARGETLSLLFMRRGITRVEGEIFVRTLRRHLNLRRMQAGQAVLLYQSEPPVDGNPLRAVAIPLPRGRSVVAVREGNSNRVRGGVYTDEEAADWIEAAIGTSSGAPALGSRRYKLLGGDNLVKVLLRAGASRDDAHRAALGLRRHVNLRRLAIGEPIAVEFSVADGKAVLMAVTLLDRGRNANMRRDAFGVFRPAVDVAAPVPEASEPPVSDHVVFEPSASPADEFASVRDRLVSRDAAKQYDDVFKRGDALSIRLQRAGMSLTEIREAVRAFSTEMLPTSIIAGQRFAFGMDGGSVSFFAVSERHRKAVLVARAASGEWTAQRVDWTNVGTAAERIASRAWPGASEDSRAALQEEQLRTALDRLRIRSGDVLLSVLTGIGERYAHAQAAAKAYGTVARLDRIQPGQKLIYPRTVADDPVSGFFLETQAQRQRGILVQRDTKGRYTAKWTATAQAERELAAQAPVSVAAPIDAPAAPPVLEADRWQTQSGLPHGRDILHLEVAARAGDTLAKILVRAGASREQVERAVRAISVEFDPRTLDIGQVLRIALEGDGAGSQGLQGFSVELDPLRSVETVLQDGAYVTHRVERRFDVVLNRTGGSIETSLYQAADAIDLPVPVLEQLVRIFSFDIDFQRELQPGDDFEVMYEGQVVDGRMVDHGRIVYAAMVVRGEKRSLYYFEPTAGPPGYFDGEGVSAAKALMRTPVDGARVSSQFGMRRHPVLGYNRMHRGTDFAASTGTPVYAAGDGVIERIGRYGAYGKYIRIRHNSDYRTAYAHLSQYAKGLTRGSRVAQGQIIGRVGSTGRSTGPHLHYEVLYRNRQVDPRSIDLPSPVLLAEADLAAFLEARNRIDSAWNDFGPSISRIAVRPSSKDSSFN